MQVWFNLEYLTKDPPTEKWEGESFVMNNYMYLEEEK